MFCQQLRRFLAREDGPTAVEYALILVAIVMVCFSAILTIGTLTKPCFSGTGDSLSAANKRGGL